jgi:hypothetical protein
VRITVASDGVRQSMGITLAGPDAPAVFTSLTARVLGPQVGLELPDMPRRDKSVGVLYVTNQRVLWVREGVAGTVLDAGDTASVPLAAVVQIDPHKWALFGSKTPRVRLLVSLDEAATPTTSPLYSVRSAAVTFAFRRVPSRSYSAPYSLTCSEVTSSTGSHHLTLNFLDCSPPHAAPWWTPDVRVAHVHPSRLTGLQRRRCGRHAVRGGARSGATVHPPRASPAYHSSRWWCSVEPQCKLPAACCRLGLRPLHSGQRVGLSGTSCPLIRCRVAFALQSCVRAPT